MDVALRWSRTGHASLTNHHCQTCFPFMHVPVDPPDWLSLFVYEASFSWFLNMETYFTSKNFSPSHPVSTESINWINLNAELVELVIPRSLFFNYKPFCPTVDKAVKQLSNICTSDEFSKIMMTQTRPNPRRDRNPILFCVQPLVCKIRCDLEFQQVYQPIVKAFSTGTNLSVHFHLFVSFIKLRRSSSLCVKIRNIVSLDAFSQMFLLPIGFGLFLYLLRAFVSVIITVPLGLTFQFCSAHTHTLLLHDLRVWCFYQYFMYK